jgi:hypothetical protein
MAYDPKDLTDEQYNALLDFARPIAAALIVGIPPDAIEAHVKGILAQQKLQDALAARNRNK